MKIYVNKESWEYFKKGKISELIKIKPSDFHYLFGDDPFQYVIELEITDKQMTGIELAEKFHNYYEKLAPSFGYETREETRVFDQNSPNGKLMISVCDCILADLKDENKNQK